MDADPGQAFLMLFFNSLTAGCVTAEERVLLTTGTTRSTCEARHLLPATEEQEHDEVTFSPVFSHLGPQETLEVRCIP